MTAAGLRPWAPITDAGGTVVVAGHSNTVPLILAALGVAGPRSIGDDEYDECWILDVFAPPRDDLRSG